MEGIVMFTENVDGGDWSSDADVVGVEFVDVTSISITGSIKGSEYVIKNTAMLFGSNSTKPRLLLGVWSPSNKRWKIALCDDSTFSSGKISNNENCLENIRD